MKVILILAVLAATPVFGFNFEKWQLAGTLSYGSTRYPGLPNIRTDGLEVRTPQDSRSFFELGGSLSGEFSESGWIFGPVVGYEPIVGANLDKVYTGRRPTALFFEDERLTETRLSKLSPYLGVFARRGSIEGQYTLSVFRLSERNLVASSWNDWRRRASGISHRVSGWYFPFEHDLGFGLYVEIAPNAARSVGASVKANFTFKRR